MRRAWSLIALAIAAFLVFAVVTFPASLALSWFAPQNVRAYGASGTLWHGRAPVLVVEGVRLGAVEWDLHALSLLIARLDADVRLTRVDGYANARLSATPAGRVSFTDLDATLPFAALPAGIAPPGWSGTLSLKLAHLSLEDAWPVDIEGTVDALNLNGPPGRPMNLGNYRITFAPGQTSGETLTGALVDTGGPLQLTGTLQLKPDRSYVIEGMIATRPDAPPGIANTLQYLGPADSQGRRPFSLAGTP